MSVTSYAAAQMRYWCDTDAFGGVGYSQPNRWSAYDNSDWDGWLHGPGEADCSAGVAGAFNIAFHHEGVSTPLFPRSTWTGSLPSEAAARGFTDIGDTWTGSAPAGGFRIGDLLTAPGHVVMVTSEEPDNPFLSELWIDAAGDILGSDGADGSTADSTGGESRTIRYSDHPFTRSASWTTCLRYTGVSGSSPQAPSTPPEGTARLSGIDISVHQRGIDISATGADFVFVKATEGSGYVDPLFRQHADEVLACGKLLGLYHFTWNSANTVKEEADTFIEAVRPYIGKAVFYLDWEDPEGWHDVTWAHEWLRQVYERTGIRPLIYMSAYVAKEFAWEPVAKDHWLWAAGYPGGYPDYLAKPDCPYAPFPHDWWVIAWQYNNEGRVPGYDTDVDLNVFYRDAAKWRSLADPNATNNDEDWLNMPTVIDFLRTIADAVTPGEEGKKHAGALYMRLVEIQAAIARIERLLQEGGKKSVYNRLDDLEHYVADMSADIKAIKKAIEAGKN